MSTITEEDTALDIELDVDLSLEPPCAFHELYNCPDRATWTMQCPECKALIFIVCDHHRSWLLSLKLGGEHVACGALFPPSAAIWRPL